MSEAPMLDFQIDDMHAHWLCHDMPQIDARNLCQTLNFIAEPSGIKLRLIQDIPHSRALLSSEGLFVSIAIQRGTLRNRQMKAAATLQADMQDQLAQTVSHHSASLSVRIGNGPIPAQSHYHCGFDFDFVAPDLRLFILETASHYLCNCLPDAAVYWPLTDRILTTDDIVNAFNEPRDFSVDETLAVPQFGSHLPQNTRPY